MNCADTSRLEGMSSDAFFRLYATCTGSETNASGAGAHPQHGPDLLLPRLLSQGCRRLHAIADLVPPACPSSRVPILPSSRPSSRASAAPAEPPAGSR